MIVLGIACGHDASAAIIRDGRVVTHVLRERITRRRHDSGIGRETIEQALTAANLSAADIDACAVADSKSQPLLCPDPDFFNIEALQELSPSTDWKSEPIRLADFPDRLAANAKNKTDHRARLHTPITVRLDGRVLPGALVDHHAAHAASSFYASNFNEALVVTHDSGTGIHSGLIFYGNGQKLFSLMPHGLEVGAFYNHAATRCGLRGPAGAGKLMGLSAYGKPALCPPGFAGTVYDWQDFLTKALDAPVAIENVHETLLDLMISEATRRGYDLSVLWNEARLPSPIAADLAASAQKIFSDSLFAIANAVTESFRGAGLSSRNLCLGGGAALNCPANTRLALSGSFDEVFIPPHCDDGGLSLGAAFWWAHNVSDQPRAEQAARASRYAMMGPDRSREIEPALAEASPWIQAAAIPDPARQAAEDLAHNLIVGWFENGSETGPRALGHRSILADPRNGDNWARVNALKKRESWRPFAPMCLHAELKNWFEQGPEASPFMLFTYNVRPDKRAQVPAICHIDGTARVQTVTPEDGSAHELLTNFAALTNVPVLLNTSFNGPGEPIVETPRDALAFFRSSKLDVLYLDGWRLLRK